MTINRQVRTPTIPSELVDEKVSVIPEQYNTKSTIVRNVGAGSNVLDFPQGRHGPLVSRANSTAGLRP